MKYLILKFGFLCSWLGSWIYKRYKLPKLVQVKWVGDRCVVPGELTGRFRLFVIQFSESVSVSDLMELKSDQLPDWIVQPHRALLWEDEE